MTLKELPIGKSATLTVVGGEGALRQHFLDMGLIPGADVTMVKYAPMGDPVELRIHSYELTLRLADAEKIEITDVRDEIKIKNQIPKEKIDHPGLGEGGKYHEKADENPLAGWNNTDICTGRKSELRKDDTVQPADRL